MATRETRSTCPYCGVGCGVIIASDGPTITGIRGDPDHPANFGRLCTKGSTLHLSAAPHLARQTRLLQPLQRLARGGPTHAIGWDTALDLAADRIGSIVQAHGPEAVGFYLSGQLLTEDYYVFNKLVKGLIGSNNVDTNSRLCMSSAVAGYKATLGSDAPPSCYEDLQFAQTVFIAGSNLAWAHPVLMRRLEDAKRIHPDQKWIVADPRRTETAAAADLHLPLLPGTDVALFHGMMHLLLWEGMTNPSYIAAHTSGFAELRDRVREFTPRHVAQVCGLREDDIVQAARWFGGHTPTLSLYCQGLNQSSSGTDKNTALINLHLATGQIGQAGAGPFSLTGQPNAMGGREVGGLANLLSAHRDLGNPAHRAEVAALWGVAEVPAKPGKTAVEMFQAAADGEIRALWIACTNPAQSMPDQTTVRRALQRCEFVVVQEAYAHTASGEHADLLLPASTWGEKEGSVTNSERRISRVRAAVPAPGQARADWVIARDLARRLERRLPPRSLDGTTMFPYETAEQVWNEHRESTRGRDLDITGLSYARLEQPQPWPYPSGATSGQTRLYGDGRFATPDGRARFAAPLWRPTAEPREARFPVSLTTGRLRDQWHGMSRTGTLGRLFAHASEPALELHPQELTRQRWQAGDLVQVSSRQGKLVLPVQPSESVLPAQAFIAMHWGPEYMTGLGVNALTSGARCPQSGQPELKHTAVRLVKAELPWQLVAAAWLPEDCVLTTRERLRAMFGRMGYGSCVLFGREPATGLLLRAALAGPADAALLDDIEDALQLAQGPVLRYADTRSGQRRAVRLQADGSLQAFMLAGDLASQGWILDLLQQGQPAAGFGRALLAATALPPLAVSRQSRQVCACHDVSEDSIAAALAHCSGSAQQRLQTLQERLRCGTECGSCLPALKAMVQTAPVGV